MLASKLSDWESNCAFFLHVIALSVLDHSYDIAVKNLIKICSGLGSKCAQDYIEKNTNSHTQVME